MNKRDSFATWSVRDPIPAVLLFVILTIAGMISFSKMPISKMPDLVIPFAVVEASLAGASASEVEVQVTQKLEAALANIQGLKHMSSDMTQGSARITLEFTESTDVDRAINDARDAVASVRDQLPANMAEPAVKRIDAAGEASLIYSITAAALSEQELARLVNEILPRELSGIKGVARIASEGVPAREITLSLAPDRLAAFGVAAGDISRELARNTLDLPGGRLTVGGSEYSVRSLGQAGTLEALRNLAVTLPQGQKVRLSELGTLSDAGAQPRSLTLLDEKQAVTLSIFRTKGASEVDMTHAIEAKFDTLEKQYPGLQAVPIFSSADSTLTTYHSTLFAFVEGTLLTVLIVFLFLRSVPATLIAAVAIPLSLLPTFIVIHWLGFSLNIVSLLAISLVTGVLVDDAIVEIENVHRHMAEGKSAYDATLVAVNEIGLAVIATTAVICAVFLPISFMDGIIGQVFQQFGLTVAVAAFFSLLVARLLTPLLMARFLKPHKPRASSRHVGRAYHQAVAWTLANRKKTLAFALLTLLGAFSILPQLSMGFLPEEDYSQTSIRMELPPGSRLEDTDAAARQVVRLLKERKEVDYVLTQIGGSAGGVNQASFTVKLVAPTQRELSQKAFEATMQSRLKQLPDMEIVFSGAEGDQDISITLLSDNKVELEQAANRLVREMRAMPELNGVTTSAGREQAEIRVTPDADKAAQLGVSLHAISEAIRTATIGDDDVLLAKFNDGSVQVPIRLKLPEQNFSTLGVLENLKVSTANGGTVNLSSLVKMSYGRGASKIEHYDRQRKIDVMANLKDSALGDVMDRIEALPAMKQLPESVKVYNSGDSEAMDELFSGFAMAMGAGLLMVYAIQVLLYKDWLHPLTRMAALPLSIGGAFLLLLLTGNEMNMPALIGILMLMGIADKNSILLVDSMLSLIRQGVPINDAIMTSCEHRARPILMTSLAMIAGMMPAALNLGLDTAFRAPMAIAVIGGLVSSTLLSLIFVPVLFSYMHQFGVWLRKKMYSEKTHVEVLSIS